MICKYKDLVMVLSFKETLFKPKNRIVKYCLYEKPGLKKQDYKDRFRSRSLFSLRAVSQILEILYLMEFYTNKGCFHPWNDFFDYNQCKYMGPVTRKPVFVLCKQQRRRSA